MASAYAHASTERQAESVSAPDHNHSSFLKKVGRVSPTSPGQVGHRAPNAPVQKRVVFDGVISKKTVLVDAIDEADNDNEHRITEIRTWLFLLVSFLIFVALGTGLVYHGVNQQLRDMLVLGWGAIVLCISVILLAIGLLVRDKCYAKRKDTKTLSHTERGLLLGEEQGEGPDVGLSLPRYFIPPSDLTAASVQHQGRPDSVQLYTKNNHGGDDGLPLRKCERAGRNITSAGQRSDGVVTITGLSLEEDMAYIEDIPVDLLPGTYPQTVAAETISDKESDVSVATRTVAVSSAPEQQRVDSTENVNENIIHTGLPSKLLEQKDMSRENRRGNSPKAAILFDAQVTLNTITFGNKDVGHFQTFPERNSDGGKGHSSSVKGVSNEQFSENGTDILEVTHTKF